MNHTAERSIGWRPPLQVLTGQTIDISIILVFMFWDVVYCARLKDKDYNGQIGNDKSSEIRGRFVGFAWDIGHALTFMILTDDTQHIISRSRLRLAKVPENNLKLDKEAGDVPERPPMERAYFHSKLDRDDGMITDLPTIDISLNPFDTSEPFEPKDGSSNQNKAGEQPARAHKDGEQPVKSKEQPRAPKDGEQPKAPDKERPGEPIDYQSPMDDPSLKDQPTVETIDEDEHTAGHLQEFDEQGMRNFMAEPLCTGTTQPKKQDYPLRS